MRGGDELEVPFEGVRRAGWKFAGVRVSGTWMLRKGHAGMIVKLYNQMDENDC